MSYLLLFSVFIIATCGLVYELIHAAIASYLLGDSITQFSTVIGVYLFSMGIGSYLSKYVKKNLIHVFIRVELIIGLLGGCSSALLFYLFQNGSNFHVALYGMVSLIGILVGLEIPLLMRILKDRWEFSELVSKIFTFDYIGALLASLLFPLILVPHLGLLRTAFLFGIMNLLIGLWTVYLFRNKLRSVTGYYITGGIFLTILLCGIIYATRFMEWLETSNYSDSIIYSKSTSYQRIVITRHRDDLRLYLNGNLQFSSRDEYRYHEALVHPVLAQGVRGGDVLILGGGDGIAAREVLKYPDIKSITLVDLDPMMTELFSTHPVLCALNNNSLSSTKVNIINADAFVWLKETNRKNYDAIIIDFPDPSNFSLGKLYSTAFYRLIKSNLKPAGVGVVQSTSPLFARQSFWCIDETLRCVGFVTQPYHTYLPSFGEWGFIKFTMDRFEKDYQFPKEVQFITLEGMSNMTHFPPDMDHIVAEPNSLNNQMLVHYFEKEWSKYTR